jgi:hypothetical protein
MEAQLAGGEPAVEESPPATNLPAGKPEPKPTRPKS